MNAQIAEYRQRNQRPSGLRQQARILAVIAGTEFKLKYAGSVLGYVWSIAKPLALFLMIYEVFAHIFKLGSVSHYYPTSLLIGIIINTFWADSTSIGMWSLVSRESLLRKLSFPRFIIPTSGTLSAAITFAINSLVILAFIAWNRITPRLDWLLVLPLILELYIFILGVALILSALFVRLRDVGQVWELVLQLVFYATPIIYPIGFLPPFARKIVFLNPLTQVIQDVRALLLYPDIHPNKLTVVDAFGTSAARLMPIGIAVATLVLGLLFFRHQEPWFAERV
jgi:ABC-2 type transport system permease protein